MSKRLEWVDYAKGIGIILVVLGHTIGGISNSSIGSYIYHQFSNISNEIFYGFHMPLFFFLSGMFMKKWGSVNIKDFFINKLKVVVCPFFVWSILQGSINVILSSVTNSKLSWIQLFTSIWYNPPSQMWFLYILFFCMVVFFLFTKVLKVKYIFVLSLIMFVLHPLCFNTMLFKFLKNFVFFTMGFIFYRYCSYQNILTNLMKPIHFFCITILFLIINVANITISLKYIVTIFVALIGIVLTIVLSYWADKNNKFKFLITIGSLSMPIFLAHVLFAAGIRIVLIKLHIYNLYLHTILGTSFGIILPIVMYKVSKHLKLNELLFGR